MKNRRRSTKRSTEPNRVRFTKRSIESLACPSGRDREWFYDTGSELALMATAAGTRTFYVYRRVDGRPQRMRIGRFPDLSIEQARKAAQRIVGEVAQGKDPMSERRRHRGEPTLADLFLTYQEHHGNIHNSEKTRRTDVSRMKLLGPLANRLISKVKRDDIQRTHRAIVEAAREKAGDEATPETGQANANRAVQLVRRLYNWATDELGYEGVNPAVRIKVYHEQSRERYLLPSELPRLKKALDTEPNQAIADFVWMALYTGARRSNVQAMKWADVDLDGQVWRIRGDETKEKDSIHVPLAGPAITILERRKAAANGSPYVFPSARRDAKTPHLVEPKATWKRICERAGIEDLRLHDLRRTLGSWQAAGGSSLQVIGKSLGHKSSQATQVYARLDMSSVRASVQSAAAALQAAAEGGE